MTRVVSVGIVGLGPMGRRHHATISRRDDAEVVAVADHHRHDLGVPWYVELDGLLRHHRPDLLVVSVPARAHHEVASTALAAGLSCVVDKPFGVDETEARSLLAATEAAGTFVAVAHTERWNRSWSALRASIVESGAAVRAFRSVRRGPRPRDTELCPAVDLAVHDADLAHDLLGATLYPVDATADESTVDVCLAASTGARVQLHAAWSPTVVRTVEVETAARTWHADLHQPGDRALDAMYDDVIPAFRERRAPRVGAADGARAVIAATSAIGVKVRGS